MAVNSVAVNDDLWRPWDMNDIIIGSEFIIDIIITLYTSVYK